MSNQERSMKWWPNIAFRIVSRPAQTFSVLISKKSLSGRAEKTMSLLSEMSGGCSMRIFAKPKPRALDAAAANVRADRRRKNKSSSVRLAILAAPSRVRCAALRDLEWQSKASRKRKGKEESGLGTQWLPRDKHLRRPTLAVAR